MAGLWVSLPVGSDLWSGAGQTLTGSAGQGQHGRGPQVTAAASEQVERPQPGDLSGPGAELVLQVTGWGRRSGLGLGSVCHQG